MNLTLKNNLPKMDDQYVQFWMDHMLNNILPKMDDHIHPTLDDYCSFCSLYKESVSYSSKFGRISHVILKLSKVEENRSIIFFPLLELDYICCDAYIQKFLMYSISMVSCEPHRCVPYSPDLLYGSE